MPLRAAQFVVYSSLVLTLFGPMADAAQAQPNPELVATTDPLSPDRERASFRLPPGFEAQLVASEPDIQKPMNLAFDARGRLWVTHTREYPFPAEEGSTPRDGVTILDDFGPDGRARTITRFAEGLNIPIGVLPLGDGSEALVYSIPNIDHFVDDDGDGKADRREPWYASIGHRDTHGMANSFTWGFDGWIYGCHGFSNDSTIAGRDGEAISLNSGNTYRLRPNGSHIEQRTWGQVNPFGLAFDPLGNLYSCDCHSRPLYQLLPGAYYPSFGKPHDGLGFGPEMCAHDHGSTGISGIAYYAAEQFPEPYRGAVFIGNVVTSRIHHDRIAWHGSTPEAIEQPDFLVSDDPWFRPVDIELGPDGALYVADFYNRIIGHYEVPLTHPGRDRQRGRIWRIVYNGDEPHAPAVPPRDDWTRADADGLLDDLGHPNLAVQTLAANEVARRGGSEGDALAQQAFADANNPARRVRGLWLLHRLSSVEESLLEGAASDPDRLVRVHAMRVLGEQDPLSESLRSLAIAGLRDGDPSVRRAAAGAMGRHPDPSQVRPLLDLRHAVDPDDTHLLHVVRMSLRDQFRGGVAWPDAGDASWSEADLRALADVAPGAAGIESARFLLAYLGRVDEAPENLRRYAHDIARHGDPSLDEALLAWTRKTQPDDLTFQAGLVREIQQGLEERGAQTPEALRDRAVELATALFESESGGERVAGLDLAGSLKLAAMFEPIAATVDDESTSAAIRIAALTTLASIEADRALGVLSRVLIDPRLPVELRSHAADLLGQGGPGRARTLLLEAIPTAPARLQPAIATALAVDRAGAEALLDLIEAGKLSARILNERQVEVRVRAAGVPDIDARLGELTRGLPPVDEAILSLLAGRRDGFASSSPDPARGAAVFEQNCANCHALSGEGAQIGPQLDGVGIRGPERLIEDVLDPNRNVDQAFRTTTLALDDGRIVSGLLLREEGEVLVLADEKGQEVRAPKAAVEENRLSQLSPMPADLAAQIPEDQFYDLLAYLLSQRQEPPPPAEE